MTIPERENNWVKKAGSWDEFLKEVETAEKGLLEEGKGHRLWYRGHNKLSYTLKPSLLRHLKGEEHEKQLFDKYKATLRDVSIREKSPWEILFEMQHYRVPTRLLDWTEVLGIAVYFAITPISDEVCVYILNPFRLNQISREADGRESKDDLITVPGDDYFDYDRMHLSRRTSQMYNHPYALLPMYYNERLQRQAGVFTIHGTDSRSLEDQFPKEKDFMYQIILKKNAVKEASQFIKIANLNAFSLFPDIEGRAEFVKNEIFISSEKSMINDIVKRISEKGTSSCVEDDQYILRTAETLKLIEWLRQEKSASPYKFVSGESGIGKTYFLLKLVCDWSHREVVEKFNKWKDSEDGKKLKLKELKSEEINEKSLLFFSFANLSGNNSGDRDSLEKAIYKRIFPEEVDLSEYGHKMSTIKKMVRNGDIVLILDGFGELVQSEDAPVFKKIKQELLDFVGHSEKAKVVISCSSHILNRFRILETFIREEDVTVTDESKYLIELKSFSSEQVRKNVGGFLQGKDESLVSDLVGQVRENPAFYGLIRDLIDELQSPIDKRKLYHLWLKKMLKGNKDDDYKMKKVYEIAGKMLDSRSEFISLEKIEDAELKKFVQDNSSQKGSGVFIQEIQDEYAFSQHSVREFIIADLISQEIEKKAFHILAEHSAFDYEGAEIYKHLSDIVKFENLAESVIGFLNPDKKNQYKKEEWNNIVRNLFEAMGMMAVFQKENSGLFLQLIDLSLSLIGREEDNSINLKKVYQDKYIYYRTKYNIVRFLERIHPSASQPYLRYILEDIGLKPYEKTTNDKFGGYAIRGFHRLKAYPDVVPLMEFNKDEQNAQALALAAENEPAVSDSLINLICKINQKEKSEELHEGTEFLRINCSFALIRWLPHQINEHEHEQMSKRIENICQNSCYYTQTNIFWMLYRRDFLGIKDRSNFKKMFSDVKIDRDLSLAPQNARDELKNLQSS